MSMRPSCFWGSVISQPLFCAHKMQKINRIDLIAKIETYPG